LKTRGEKQYINMPPFAVRLYDNLTNVKGVNRGFEEIALFISSYTKSGRLLDVGNGPGRLLLEINRKAPGIDLFGIDISEAMTGFARDHLKNINHVDLRTGNIVKTDYVDDFFDCIVSTGSFYNWDKPVEGLNEIFRILKPGKSAYIFESYRDYNKSILSSQLNDNLKDYNLLRKVLSKYFLRKQLKMTYSASEFDRILKQTKFNNNYRIEKTDLGDLSVYVRIELIKQ
jgi:ubiquinone/menaquinone biosynthesis C-methylase UbiE